MLLCDQPNCLTLVPSGTEKMTLCITEEHNPETDIIEVRYHKHYFCSKRCVSIMEEKTI
jgi:hypothetical protein